MKQKYYIVADKERIIWGVGKTKLEAREDAMEHVKHHQDTYGNSHKYSLQKAIQCNEYLYEFVLRNGAGEGDTWNIHDGIAKLDEEILDIETKLAMHSPFNTTSTDFNKFDVETKLTILFNMIKEMKNK